MADRADDAVADRLRSLSRGFQEARILLTGVEVGLFERLARGPATAVEVARDRDLTLRGTEIVLDALVAMGLVTKNDGVYANTPDADRLLIDGGAESQAHILRHVGHTFRAWAQLDDVVRHGLRREEQDKATLADPVANRHFILGMAEVSRERVGPIVDLLPLEGARRLVDLGGGPGHYACAAVQRFPELAAAVVDLPLTISVARDHLAAQGLADRIETVVCDFYRADPLDLGGPADVVLISQVLHAEGPDENQALLSRLAPHVRPGGWVVVSENAAGPDRTAPLPAALFAVNMLAGTARGRTYTTDEMAGWLRRAGFEPEAPIAAAERTTVLRARKRPI